MMKNIICVILTLFFAGCAVQTPHNRGYISDEVKERVDFELGDLSEPGEFSIPDGVLFADGLTQGEAVATALWNNAQFQVDLGALGFVRADLVEASLLSNPVLSVLFPTGPKQLETTLTFPIDVLWQRPRRKAAALLNAEAVSENLVQHGLGLIRNVRTAYTDLILSQEHVIYAERDAEIRNRIAVISRIRFDTGDISDLDATAVQVDARKADDTVIQRKHEATIARHRLFNLMGMETNGSELNISPTSAPSLNLKPFDKILETAFASRPDLRAAELSIESAGKRVGLERSRIIRLIGIIDGEDKGEENFSIGPGAQIAIPIFNQNNGAVSRAQADLEQTARNYVAIRHKIILETQEAYDRYLQIQKEFTLWDSDIIPSLEKAVDLAKVANEAGEESYLFVLNTMRELNNAQIRHSELVADMQRAAAQLSFSIGRNLD